MQNREYIKEQILHLFADSSGFEEVCALVFAYQKAHNPLYAKFCSLLNRTEPNRAPFLPVELFKNHHIQSGVFEPETVFTSSGTTGAIQSRHFVRELAWYAQIFTHSFAHFYGAPSQYSFLCLLPSYLEREGSSLIYMAEQLIKQSVYDSSGFYLKANDTLLHQLTKNEQANIPTVLLGVSFALLDLAEQHALQLGQAIVMETGGMKGRRKEMTREELHQELTKGLGVTQIHSEYGMTEMMSQAYSKGAGIFQCPPQLKIVITDVNDPFEVLPPGRTGSINIIDLGNLDSCAFIATNDLGKVYADGRFEVLGRYDHSDVRGCNLLIA